MAKDGDFNFEQDEYQLKEEVGEPKFGAGEPSREEVNSPLLNSLPPSPAKSKKFKRLLVPLGLIVVIFVVYNFLNWYSTRRSQSEANQEQAIAKKTARTQELPRSPKTAGAAVATTGVNNQGSVVNPQQQVPSVMMSSASVGSQQLDMLEKQGTMNREQLAALNERVQQNQEMLQDLTKKVEDLTTSMQGLQEEMVKYYTALKKPKKAKVRKSRPLPLYRVHAIVPERAWLESSDGADITVKVGDKIPGYGIVEMVSPRQGMVVTSNGSIIQYGVNDF